MADGYIKQFESEYSLNDFFSDSDFYNHFHFLNLSLLVKFMNHK